MKKMAKEDKTFIRALATAMVNGLVVRIHDKYYLTPKGKAHYEATKSCPAYS